MSRCRHPALTEGRPGSHSGGGGPALPGEPRGWRCRGLEGGGGPWTQSVQYFCVAYRAHNSFTNPPGGSLPLFQIPVTHIFLRKNPPEGWPLEFKGNLTTNMEKSQKKLPAPSAPGTVVAFFLPTLPGGRKSGQKPSLKNQSPTALWRPVTGGLCDPGTQLPTLPHSRDGSRLWGLTG